MDSFGVFNELNLKKSNDLMEVFDRALAKTNNFSKVLRLEDYLEHCNLVYRVYLLEFDLIRSYDRSHIYI